MKKLFISIIVVLVSIFLGLSLYGYLSNLPPDLKKCLEKQKEVYKPGWEGQPTRVPNTCEKFAEQTSDNKAIIFLSATKDIPTLAGLARNSSAPSEILVKIYQRGEEAVYSSLAQNTNTPPNLLKGLVEKRSFDISLLNLVARNSNTPPETIMELSKSKYPSILYAIAQNPKAPPNALSFIEANLADTEGGDSIRSALASNPNTSKEVLKNFLTENADSMIIWNFKDNIVRIDKEILELEDWYKNNVKSEKYKYGESQYHRLIYDLAKNPKTSVETLEIILERYGDLTNSSYGYSVKTFWGSKSMSETIPEAANKNLESRN